MIKLGKVLSVIEKNPDLVLSVDLLGVVSVHLEPGRFFFAVRFFVLYFSKIGSKCKSVAI